MNKIILFLLGLILLVLLNIQAHLLGFNPLKIEFDYSVIADIYNELASSEYFPIIKWCFLILPGLYLSFVFAFRFYQLFQLVNSEGEDSKKISKEDMEKWQNYR